LAAIKEKNVQGKSVLHIAASSGDVQTTKAILEIYPEDQRLAAINQKDIDGVNVLHEAAFSSNSHVFDTILGVYTPKRRLTAIRQKDNTEGWNVLHYAACSGDVATVAAILKEFPKNQCFAFVNEKDIRGNTVLHSAVEDGCREMISLLLEYGSNINAKNNQQKTPLDLNKKLIKEILGAKRSC
jgi:ankyrin repeat protein